MRSNTEWEYWGKADPLWAVASWNGRERDGANPWSDDEFFATGARDFGDAAHHWRHYGMGSRRCIEIGCGVGRITRQLLLPFEHVLAIDVSTSMLDRARQYLAPAGDRVEFALVGEPAVPAEPESCDGMFTCHVFQHFAEPAGVWAYLQATYRALMPGGTICFHIPVPGAHRALERPALRTLASNLLVDARRLLGRKNVIAYHWFSASEVARQLEATGFRDVELRIFPFSANGDPHSFFFARKPGAPA